MWCLSSSSRVARQLLECQVVLAILLVALAQQTSSSPLTSRQEELPLEEYRLGLSPWSDNDQLEGPFQLNKNEELRAFNLLTPKHLFKGSISQQPDDDDDDGDANEEERPKRNNGQAAANRHRASNPVRRNGRELGPILETVDTGAGHSLQDLNQIRGAIKAWEAKLAWFANKFEHHPETLKTNPVWNKLMRIRNSLVQLANAEEMRQSGLDETRM